MDISVLSAVPSAATSTSDSENDGFELDVRIVEAGPGRLALLSSTDDNCDTKKPGDC